MKKVFLGLLAVIGIFTLVACGGGGGGAASTCVYENPVDPTYSLDGTTWNLAGTVTYNPCTFPVSSFNISNMLFSVSGNTITATASGQTLSGQISGNTFKVEGAVDGGGGEIISIQCTEATLSSSTRATFTDAPWTNTECTGTGYTDGVFSR